ncbi:Undecaprenyl phosphate N,N'-diacetylbacillosamine 1-phosphate transferase [Flavobacterium columnare]|uniref:Undecaprenyl phosphate N,N'-diacetylbacillosamine 1-phosphate transferase n=1 Tax=Flavobacterium columnare TaxID=996 RepID=A0A2N9P969_9FLAO|nr:sugar transferase [Flavobacterium columnare]SPE76866.1 Undecaprenyl phosphate N,N'-diacetylbacillosamine 1-phosphate transferase [Flavobacterium columnare]
MYKRILKKIFDIIFSLLVIILVSPLFLIIFACLYVVNDGIVFFHQKRIGQNQSPFIIYKFKTMNDKRDNKGELLSDEYRLTKIGKIVRKTSLDELPQLFNILKGDMSLIGPRPLLPEYLPIYSEEQNRRHDVKPGITGWAQVNGRNAISWTRKFELDIWYVDNISFRLDFKIILLTIKKVVVSEGINSEGVATTEAFNGKN